MIASLFLAAALTFAPEDAKLAFSTARVLVERFTPRDPGTIRSRLASNALLDAASAAGADVRRDVFRSQTPKGEREFVNLYAAFRSGKSDDRWVILLSHYDTKTGRDCPGANDGASTSGLLVGLANAYSKWETPRGNLLLVWTDGEECFDKYGPEDGFWGSKRAVAHVRALKLNVQAVVCLDMLGDRDLSIVIPANGTPSLRKIAVHAAARCGQPELVRPIDDSVKDDHVAFLAAGYKAIDLIDFSYGPNNSYWHTREDTIEHISEDSLLKSGRLVAEMLNILL